MQIDTFTLTLVAGVLTIALAVVMLPALGTNRAGLRSSLGLWTVAIALQGLYWPLFWYGRHMPPLFGLVPPNMMLTLSFAVFALAVQRFKRAPVRHVWLGAIVLLALAGNLWFGVAEPSYAGRVAVIGTSLSLLMVMAATPLLGAFRQPGEMAERITAAVFLGGALVMMLRVVELPFMPDAHVGPLQQRPTQLLTLLYVPLMPVFITIGFLLMHARRANEELVRLAGTDALTGTLNRRAATEFGNRAMAEARRHRRPLSALLVDIDHFRVVNDNYGPRAGDAVLRSLARHMAEQLRTEDAIGRIGGEEFVAILPDTDLGEARAVAERIREAVGRRHCLYAGEEIPSSVSIGVAGREQGEADIEVLLQRADAAMYAAKRAGRDRVQVAPGSPEGSRSGGADAPDATMGG